MPQSLDLSYGDYTFANLPTLRISRESVSDRSNSPTRITWQIDGELWADSADGLADAINQLTAALESDGHALVLKQGDATLHALDRDALISGPALASLELAPIDPKVFKPHQGFRARFVALASADEANAWLSEVRMELCEEAGALDQIVWQGKGVRSTSVSEEDCIALLAPELAEGWRRIEQRFTFGAGEGESVSFTIIDQAVLLPLPSGVSDGHYQRTRASDADGRETETIEGHFTGDQAEAHALALRPSRQRLIDQQLSRDPFTGRVTFRFTALVRASVNAGNQTGGTSRDRYFESISFNEKRRVVDHQLLGRTGAYRQSVGAPEYRVVQEGRASRAGSAPPPEAPRWPGELIERDVSYHSTRAGGPMETRWRYVFAPMRAPLAQTPRR